MCYLIAGVFLQSFAKEKALSLFLDVIVPHHVHWKTEPECISKGLKPKECKFKVSLYYKDTHTYTHMHAHTCTWQEQQQTLTKLCSGGGWGAGSVVQHLPSIYKALPLISSAAKTETKNILVSKIAVLVLLHPIHNHGKLKCRKWVSTLGETEMRRCGKRCKN